MIIFGKLQTLKNHYLVLLQTVSYLDSFSLWSKSFLSVPMLFYVTHLGSMVNYLCVLWRHLLEILHPTSNEDDFLLTGVVLFLVMPGNTVIPMAALAYGICVALGLPKGITMAALVPAKFLFSPHIFVFAGIGQAATGPLTIGWLEFFKQNFIFLFYYMILFFVITKMFKPKVAINGKDFFQDEYNKLGRINGDEKRALAIVAILFVFLLTGSIHKIDLTWGFALIPLMMFLLGLQVAIEADIAKINWGMIIFTVGCLSIGTAGGALGLGTIVANLIMLLIKGKTITFFLGLIYGAYVLLNFLLTPMP